MKTTVLGVVDHETLVLVDWGRDGHGENQAVASFKGSGHSQLAQAFIKALTVECADCGGLAGNHHDVFIKTSQDGFGSVEGRYQRCSQADKEQHLILVDGPAIQAKTRRIRS